MTDKCTDFGSHIVCNDGFLSSIFFISYSYFLFLLLFSFVHSLFLLTLRSSISFYSQNSDPYISIFYFETLTFRASVWRWQQVCLEFYKSLLSSFVWLAHPKDSFQHLLCFVSVVFVCVCVLCVVCVCVRFVCVCVLIVCFVLRRMTKGKRKLEKDDEARGKTVSHEVVRDRNKWMRE